MPSSSLHIILYNWLKPFLEEAKRKGFHVSPDTHIKIVAVLSQCAGKIEDETVLFDYFSPLVAKNKEDYQLLKSEWEKWCGREKLIVDRKIDKKKKYSYRWIIVSVAALVLLFAGWFLYLFFSVHTVTADYKITYTDVTKPVQFDAMKSVSDSADTARIRFIWNFGDGTTDTSKNAVVRHRYHKAQSYSSSLTLLPLDSNITIVNHEQKTPFVLCKPALYFTQQPDENVTTGQKVAFSINYDSLYPSSGKTAWTVNGKTMAKNTETFSTTFDSALTYTIAYTDAGYVAGTHCDSTITTSVTVKPSSALNFFLSQTGSLVFPPLNVNWHNIAGLVILLLYLLGQYVANKRKQQGRNKETASRSGDIMTKLKGTKPPYEIPFKNKDESIDDEPLLPALAKNFKRRVADENLYLNILLTISSTIKSEGFLLPVFSQKTKPSEYLILIDKSHVKSAQVKLFEYLVKRFAKSDIYTDTFYFYDKPDYGFNAYYPRGIYVSLLYDLYPDHTVIIFGSGYSFIDKYYPALNEATTLPYTKWTNHVIFTPVPYADWGGKEILLQKRFLLLPADMEGQLLLFNYIDKPETFTTAGLQPLEALYKTKGFNANKAEKIKQYLDNEFLFQWLCALAISPSIYWQTMLGIGDALQKQRYYNEVIQYRSLLKLVRISWMRDAAFPEEVRLDLLKQLEPQNEKIARQTMIAMMEEAALKADENTFAFEELYLQQMTDKFVLYASDAHDNEFKNYKTAHDEFKALWKENKITDVVLKEYLKKEDGGEWSTLIGNQNLLKDPHESVSIDTLFDDGLTASKSKWLQRTNRFLVSLMALTVLFMLSIFLFKKQWSNTYVNDKLKLVSADSSTTVPFTLRILNNQCLNSLRRQQDSVVVTLDFGNNNTLSLTATDTSKQKNIPYKWLDKQQVMLHVSSRNVAYHFDSSLFLTSDQLSLSVNGCAISCNQWKDRQTNNLETAYNGDWYDNNITSGSGTTYTSTHIEPNSINGEKIAKVEACEDNNQLLRIITRNNYNAFSLYYFLQTDVNIISFAVQGTSYETLASVEKDTTGFDMTTLIRPVSNPASFSNNHDFFAFFNGKWVSEDDTDFIDISSAQNIMTTNGKYPFTVLAEQQTKTTWGKPLYKISALKKGSSPTDSFHFYFLQLDTNRVLISVEEEDKDSVHYSVPDMSTFEKFHKQSTKAETITPAVLPQSLNEIWHGGTSNRLITLFLPKNVIYYSVNDTKTFGTYNIDAVSLLSDGTYKIITKTNGGYKLFFIKNVSSAAFDLSVCQDFLKTKDEAIGKTAANCDHFNTMSLYYENDPSAIYLPVSFSNNLVAFQKAKLDKIVAAINNKTATVGGFNVSLSYTPPNLSNTLNAMNSFLQKNGINNKITAADVNSSVTNRPFTRSYVQIKTTPDTDISTPVQTNYNNDVKQETATETNLGTLQFDEKSGSPDAKSLQLIAAVAKQLNNDTASRVKIYCNYVQEGDNYTTAQQYVNTTLNLFRKENVAVSRANIPLQIETAFQAIAASNAVQAPRTATKAPTKSKAAAASHYISVSINGINFPANFNTNTSQKAY